MKQLFKDILNILSKKLILEKENLLCLWSVIPSIKWPTTRPKTNGSIFIVDFNNSSTVHMVNVSFFKLNFQNTNTISLCVNQLIYRFTSDIGWKLYDAWTFLGTPGSRYLRTAVAIAWLIKHKLLTWDTLYVRTA